MPLPIANLERVLAGNVRAVPTIVVWNRLEARPRSPDFDRALRAEVRDALWMLTRQWQVGEFEGDDAGMPLAAKVYVAHSHLTRVSSGGHSEAYDDNTPLEAKVERQRISFTRGGSKLQLDLRMELGRRFTKLLGAAGLGGYQAAYLEKYPFTLPAEDHSTAAADVYGHPDAWQEMALVAGRALDGGDLYLQVVNGGKASDGIALGNPADGPQLDALGAKLVAWFDGLYFQPPSGSDAWQANQLEYSFSCAAPVQGSEKTLIADQYPGGHLDWYAFDSQQLTTRLSPVVGDRHAPDVDFQHRVTRSFLPSPISFDGMPNTRWWKFEDAKVSFGDISPATTDLAKLLLIEFGLVYANDWFLLPFKMPAGSLALVRGMTVTNSFGEHFWLEAAGSGKENEWQKWRMFNLHRRDQKAADMTLLLAPAVPKIQEGQPLDEVYYLRDEMANMVWGVETQVPMATGATRPGKEVGRETRSYHRRKLGAAPDPQPWKAPIYYQSMTDVPEHWIPFLPVHTAGSQRETQLQRGALLRRLPGDPSPPPIEPMTPTLRRGRDVKADESKQPFFVHEEEVPRSGTRLTRSFQRTRWRGGRTFVWLGMRRETGRGEGASQLLFDNIGNVKGYK